MDYALLVLSGALLCNCIPHLTCGLRGARFPTPFGKPRGRGTSSARTNFMWGFANMMIGVNVLVHRAVLAHTIPGRVCLLMGFFLAGLYLQRHFSQVRQDAQANPDAIQLG